MAIIFFNYTNVQNKNIRRNTNSNPQFLLSSCVIRLLAEILPALELNRTNTD